jgi:hypothetical protein
MSDAQASDYEPPRIADRHAIDGALIGLASAEVSPSAAFRPI